MTRSNTSDRRKWLDGSVFFVAAGLAVILVLGATGTTLAVGLTYVDGMPGSTFGETPNMFRTGGTAIGSPGDLTVVNSETNSNTDNAWGWRDFGATNTIYDPTPGVVDLDYSSVYESLAGQENSPEVQMRLTGTHGIAASTSYDVYVAYWSDSTNWNVRAGFQPGTVGTPLQVFANNNTVAGEIAGTFGSSAAWDSQPLDNPTDENTTGATDSNSNPFLDVTPGAPANSTRNMLLGRIGSITSGSQAGAAANEIRVWIDDLGTGDGGRRSWFDGLAFVPTGNEVFVTADVDRDTGNVTVHNTTTQPFNVVGYSLTSTAGALNGGGVNNAPWLNVTANTLAGFTDTDNDWALVGTPSAFSTELREQDGGLPAGAQDGIVLPALDTTPMNLGDLWRRSPFQDVRVVLRLADGTPETFDDNPTITIAPTYSGDALVRGDFNGDGEIGVLDYIVLMQNLHKPQGTLTRAEYYTHGDINDTNAVNRDDFYVFRAAYLAANPGAGGGGFAAMAAEAAQLLSQVVPEPSTLLLALVGGGFLSLRPRRRSAGQSNEFINKDSASMNERTQASRRFVAVAAAFVLAACITSTAQAVPVTGWAIDPLVRDPMGAVPITDAGTNSPTFGNNTANNADNIGVWGSTASPVSLTPNFEAVLNGRVRFIGATPANGRDLRWGMWKKFNNGSVDTSGWLGYLAAGGSGVTAGRLYARNPDDPAFNTASFLSTVGDASIAPTSGPAPTTGSPLDSNANVGTGTGRYFLLSETPPVNNSAFTVGAVGAETWYTFEIRVGRYGDEVTSSGRLVSDAVPAIGDYNNDNSVDAADYTVWRNNFGQPATNLLNRDPANLAATVDESHYGNWSANYGRSSAPAFDLRLGGGLDFNGNPAPALDAMGMPVAYTNHLTFEFDRVGMLIGDQMNADQIQMQNVDISVSAIQTIDLHVNTTTGAVNIRNNLGTAFDINYYEITSTLGVLESDNWTSLDEASGGSPATNDYLTGWDEAGGASDFVLSEGNFVDSSSVVMGSPISLGDVFKTATPMANRDIRFFAGLTNGDVIRGTVTYAATPPGGGGLASVPEPGTLWLLLVAGGGLLTGRRR